jgi:hypothetical protein
LELAPAALAVCGSRRVAGSPASACFRVLPAPRGPATAQESRRPAAPGPPRRGAVPMAPATAQRRPEAVA